MSASRVRVRLPHSHWGLALLSVWLGALASIPLVFAAIGPEWITLRMTESTYIAIAMVPVLLFVAWLVTQCHHQAGIAPASASYAISFYTFLVVPICLHFPFIFVYSGINWMTPAGAVIAVCTVTILSLVALGVCRSFVFRLVEQDGTLCEVCAYPAGRSRSTRCPECGSPANEAPTTSRTSRLIEWIARHRLFSIGPPAAIIVIGIVWLLLSARDHRLLGNDSWDGGPWETVFWSLSAPLDFGPATCAHQPFSEGSVMHIAVDLAQRSAWQSRHMRIRIASRQSLASTGRPRSFEIVNGDPVIQCIVPPEHITAVLRNGPPAELISRLQRAAEQADWKPADQWYAVREIIEVPWSDE